MTQTLVWKRKVIHVDMDAFFASVEQRDRPELRGKPVVVGGDPQSRGVVSTASYEARKFGIRSAMPAAHAKKLCPNAIFLRPNFKRYQEVSEAVMSVLRQHTDLVEPVSIDEAYLDVSQHRYGIDDPIVIAKMIKQNIHAITQLTASAGVASNMFLAKIASDFQKPDGLTVVYPDKAESFLLDLPVRKIPGVGPVTEKELHALGVFTVGQIREKEPAYWISRFGKFGAFLVDRSQGIDDREVEPHTESKQYSLEETFPKDIQDKQFLKAKISEFSDEIFSALQNENRMGRTIVLKVKYHDFELITRSKTLPSYPESSAHVTEIACRLLEDKTSAGIKPIRLIGLGISGLGDPVTESNNRFQKELF